MFNAFLYTRELKLQCLPQLQIIKKQELQKSAEHVFVQLDRVSMCKQHLMFGQMISTGRMYPSVYTPALLSLMVINSHGVSIAGTTDLNADDVLSSI